MGGNWQARLGEVKVDKGRKERSVISGASPAALGFFAAFGRQAGAVKDHYGCDTIVGQHGESLHAEADVSVKGKKNKREKKVRRRDLSHVCG